MKSHVGPQKIMNRVAIAVNKENSKKFSPSKVKKSPRPVSRTVTSRGKLIFLKNNENCWYCIVIEF